MSYLSRTELEELGFKYLGEDVRISNKASIYSPETIIIGNHVRIDDFCILSGPVMIGNWIHLAAYSALYGGKLGIEIHDFCNISSRVCIYAASDDYSGNSMTNPLIPEKYKNIDHGKVVVEKHSIIGTASTVLPGVCIGEGCSFGAYSLIKESCAPWMIYAGIPCRAIKNREKKILELECSFLSEQQIE